MDWIERSLFGILWAILAFVAFVLVDVVFIKRVEYTGIIIDKHYAPSQSSYGVGNTINANGQVGIISTSSYEAEKFLIMVKTVNGQIVTTESEPELYYKNKIGDSVLCKSFLGRLTGIDWYNETIK